MTVRGTQLALKFPLSPRARFETFEVGDNGELVGRLEVIGAEPGFSACLVHGAAGGGRTHLLQAACHRRGEQGGRAIYLPLADASLGPASLEGLDALDLVAVDDADRWLGDADSEAALLALYNGLQARGGGLVVSSGAPPARLEFHYPDLASRLRGLPTYHVAPLKDEAKVRLLKRLAAARGLHLGDPVLNFWLARRSRDLASLLDDLERLDDVAMAAQRQVTVPLLKDALGL